MYYLSATSAKIIEIIKSIPKGKVMSYGQVARAAGMSKGARLVVRVLHSSSDRYDLPWWRVLKATGELAFPEYGGAWEQKERLEAEGVVFKSHWMVDLKISGYLTGEM